MAAWRWRFISIVSIDWHEFMASIDFHFAHRVILRQRTMRERESEREIEIFLHHQLFSSFETFSSSRWFNNVRTRAHTERMNEETNHLSSHKIKQRTIIIIWMWKTSMSGIFQCHFVCPFGQQCRQRRRQCSNYEEREEKKKLSSTKTTTTYDNDEREYKKKKKTIKSNNKIT